jgi:tight adherence protein B
MSNGMRSGLSIVQSLALVVQEMPDPIRQEFNLVLNENKVGVPLEEAFLNLSKRVTADDVEMFVTAVNILKETGGNLAETFDTIVITIRERVKLEKKIQALTAQGFNQGMFLLALVPILGFLFHQSDPEFMKPVFTTPIGWIVLVVIAGMLALALVFILRIVKIEV